MIIPGFKTSATTRTEILDTAVKLVYSQLYSRYAQVPLSELATISSGGTPSRGDPTLYNGDIPWAKIGDITEAGKWIDSTEECITKEALQKSTAKMFPKGTVLFSIYGSIGKTTIVARPLATNQAIIGLEPKPNIPSEYLYYCLINARLALFADAKGTSQKNINGRMVKTFLVPIPPPDIVDSVVKILSTIENGEDTSKLLDLPKFLKDQCSIVKRIESLAAKVEKAHSIQRKAMEESEALNKSISATKVKTLTAQYGLLELDDFIIEAGYGTSIKCGYTKIANSVAVLRIPNVASELINFDNIKYGQISSSELNRVLLAEGDILVVRTNGSADLVGRCAVVPALSEPTAFASYLIRIRCDRNIVTPEYLQLLLKYLRTENQLVDFARTTAGQYNVSLGRLRIAKIPVPPLSEQLRVVAYLNHLQKKVDALKHHQVETAAQVDMLLPSILDRAFNGML
ncbi:MAG: restriction endonuclease subunit S [Thaumarchaeota archaeon]|nr:restriction endonuclease subunit S [Nitrososphaerota archaeon]